METQDAGEAEVLVQLCDIHSDLSSCSRIGE
jgi:hypothetical protein